MADRYWVGGSGSWTPQNTANWSAISGGAPGAPVPTAADNVIFDANSSAASYTVTASGGVGQIFCGGFITGFPASGAFTFNLGNVLNVNGSVYLHNGLLTQFIAGSPHLYFVNSTPANLTTNGINLPWLVLAGGTSTLTLQDDLNCTINDGTLIIRQGTFDANGKNITTQAVMNNNRILIDANEEPYYWEYSTVKFGTGVWTLTGSSAVWSYLNPQLVTHVLPVNPADSVVRIINNLPSDVTFGSPIAGFSKAFGTLEIATTGAGATIFSGNHTFAKLKVTGTARTLKFQAGKTFTFAAFECSGTAGNLNTFAPNTAGQAYSFAKSGGGVVSNDYLSISYCNASPASTWYAGTHSTNGGSNTGWTFTAPPAVDLSAAACSQSATGGTGAISQAHVLVMAPSIADSVASASPVVQAHMLAAAACAQAASSSTGAGSQTHILAASPCASAATCSTGQIAGAVDLSAAACSQSATGGTGAIAQAHVLVMAPSIADSVASASPVVQAHMLAAAGCAQAAASATGASSQTHILSASPCASAATCSTGQIAGAVDLSAAACSQSTSGGTGAVAQAHVLVMAPSIADSVASASPVVQAHIMAAAGCSQQNLSASVSLPVYLPSAPAHMAARVERATVSTPGVTSATVFAPGVTRATRMAASVQRC